MAIVNCVGSVCKSDYQDKKYGRGKRVANEMAHSASGKQYKCTVCLAISDEGKVDKSFEFEEE